MNRNPVPRRKSGQSRVPHHRDCPVPAPERSEEGSDVVGGLVGSEGDRVTGWTRWWGTRVVYTPGWGGQGGLREHGGDGAFTSDLRFPRDGRTRRSLRYEEDPEGPEPPSTSTSGRTLGYPVGDEWDSLEGGRPDPGVSSGGRRRPPLPEARVSPRP